MPEPEPTEPFDRDAAAAETLEFLAVERDGDGWVGQSPSWFGDVLFGGFVIAQAIAAVTRTAPESRRLHSAHAYFLRPVIAGRPLTYAIDPIRDGRSFSSRRVDVTQGDQPVLAMMCSFTSDTDGYVYDLPIAPDAGKPGDYPEEGGPGPWISGWVGPTPPAADGTRVSTHRHWFRFPAALPDDPHLHAALLGFASDWTGNGGRPLYLEGDITGMISLDHSVWFHRPARADAWHFFDVHSLVNAGGRGVLRGAMFDVDGRVVASVAQEMRLTPVEE